MADPKDQKTQLYEDYTNGYLLRDAQVGMVRAFNLIPLFPSAGVKGSKLTVIKSTPIDKFKDKDGGYKKVAEGADVRRIVGEVETADGLTLVHNEIEYVISNEDMNRPTFNLPDELKAMTYVLGLDAEEVLAKAIRAAAKIKVDADKLTGKWADSGTTTDILTSDVTEIIAASRGTPIKINWLAYGNRANIELTKKCGIAVGNWKIPQNEYEIDSAISFGNAQHLYGGEFMNDGELFGGDINNPGVKVFYQEFENPEVKQAPLPEGMNPKFAPFMRMMMFDDSKTSTKPKTTIKVANAVGAYIPQEGHRLFSLEDILS